ncbi:MAG TPA: chemotaxis protein CheB [Burkholderiaceae bacterium]|nr:chemotaxis protein CheB [Burkholderiaceae bacterium]
MTTEDPSAAAAGGPEAAPATPIPLQPTAADRPPLIVGLGASAGGLEAFEQFFRTMTPDSGMGFVLVQHLDPSHASMLTEILQRITVIPVVEAQDGMVVEANRVHVIPPNRDMVIAQGRLLLNVPAEPRGQRMPIDAFLRSLAEDQGDNAIAIILSGTGTDGTLGMRAVFGAGGLCLVQDPATAKFGGMPASAVHAGYVNQVLPVAEMPQALLAIARHLPVARVAPAAPAAGGESGAGARGFGQILALLRAGTGHDFAQYKQSTIGRRIERRMAQHLIEDPEIYARYLKEHPSELKVLFRELLINVTSFFRDAEAFDLMKSEILPALLVGKPAGYTMRVWVAGCATGEEAYSIAMILRELIDTTHPELKLQLYSTDLDDDAIATARAGLYPLNIAQDVSAERLRRFFNQEDAGYRVKKEIREMVVFAVQSVIKDPPFTRLDLLSCRNLMIYLEPDLQNRLIPAFHYALKPGGILFLSPSESVGNHTELFDPLHRKWKFYRAKPTIASTRSVLTSGLSWAVAKSAVESQEQGLRVKEFDVGELARRALLQSFTPAAVVTDLQGNILYVHGETGRFLRPAPGQPTHNVVEMAREGLQIELREALNRATLHSLPTINEAVTIRTDGETLPVDLSVRLLPDIGAGTNVLLVSFQERTQPVPGAPVVHKRKGRASGSAIRAAELERELDYAKQSMKALLEEQQASNEELKSINEELQSTNEELQSTNEELETSKEELQSVNEELVTVNSELQTKIEQMAGMQDDMKNLLDNIRVGTIFLDRNLLIRRFTREATKVYRLLASDLGRPLADIRSDLSGGDPLADAQAVLDSLVPIERELSTPAGAWYLARIQPYRTVDNVIDGVVLTFTDVTERVHAIATRQARDLAEAVVDAVPEPLVVLDGQLQVMSCNRAFYREFGGSVDDTVGQSVFEVGQRRWDFTEMHDLLESVLPRERSFEGRVIEHDFQRLGVRTLRLSARRVLMPAGSGELVLLVIEPIARAAG